jgi:hypothetical protein
MSFLPEAFTDPSNQTKSGPDSEKESGWTVSFDHVSIRNVRLQYNDVYNGLHASANLNHFDVKNHRTDLSEAVFDIDTLLLDGLMANVLITKFKEKEERESDILPVISADRILISNINLNYNDSVNRQSIVTELREFRINDASADLREEAVNIDEFYLAESNVRIQYC